MAEPAWILSRRARLALSGGQPDEAQKIYERLKAAGNRRAYGLRGKVVEGYVKRAEAALRTEDNAEAAWRDLFRAEKLDAADRGVVSLRDTLTQLGLKEVRSLLEAGRPLAAIQAAARLRDRPVQSSELDPLMSAARDWVMAEEYTERGEFQNARSAIRQVRSRLPKGLFALDKLEGEILAKEARFHRLREELHDAADARDWRRMVRSADEVLEVAPLNPEAQEIRGKAWQALQPDTIIFAGPVKQEREDLPEPTGLPLRFFLWIDGVGGYLVCTRPRVALGQAAPQAGPIDVPLYADVSRFHATLIRDEECTMIETTRELLLNGKPTTRAVLRDGDRIVLPGACHLEFEQRVPNCLSARLTPDNSRRLPMAVEGVLLMADMLILGSGENSHITMPDLDKPIFLLRQKDSLAMRYAGEFHVEGNRCRDKEVLPRQGTVSGETFTFAVEPVSV